MKKKKFIMLIVVILIFIAMHNYNEQKSSGDPPKGMIERLTEWAEVLGWE